MRLAGIDHKGGGGGGGGGGHLSYSEKTRQFVSIQLRRDISREEGVFSGKSLHRWGIPEGLSTYDGCVTL